MFHFNSHFYVILIQQTFEMKIRKLLFDRVKMLFEKEKSMECFFSDLLISMKSTFSVRNNVLSKNAWLALTTLVPKVSTKPASPALMDHKSWKHYPSWDLWCNGPKATNTWQSNITAEIWLCEHHHKTECWKGCISQASNPPLHQPSSNKEKTEITG